MTDNNKLAKQIAVAVEEAGGRAYFVGGYVRDKLLHIENKDIEKICELDCKIERLVTALSESSEISVSYISQQIEKLHSERETLLSQNKTKKYKESKINLNNSTFEEKKIIASQFIEKILLNGDTAEIIWKL